MLRRAIFALALLAPIPSWAQSQNILPLIAQFESAGIPTAQNPTSSASGLYGDINSTWANALSLCNCGTLSQYPNAASAPPSVQTAANAALINSQGLRDWLCPGCDPPLAAAINAAGGPGAFQTSGLSTNPADYAALNTPAGLQQFFGSAPIASNGTTLPDGSQVVAATQGSSATIALVPGTVMTPFTSAYNFVTQTIQPALAAATNQVQTVLGGGLAILLVALAIMIRAWAVMWGKEAFEDFLWMAGRVVLVSALIFGSVWFNAIFTNFVLTTMPNWIGSLVGVTGNSPAAPYDAALFNFWVNSNTIISQAPGQIAAVGISIIVGFLFFVLLVMLIILFGPFFLALLALALIAGPFMPLLLFGLLFEYTRRFWDTAVCLIVGIFLGMFVVDLGSQLLGDTLSADLAAITFDSGVWTALYNVAASLVKIALVGALIPMGWKMAQAIGGAGGAIAAAAPADTIKAWMK